MNKQQACSEIEYIKQALRQRVWDRQKESNDMTPNDPGSIEADCDNLKVALLAIAEIKTKKDFFCNLGDLSFISMFGFEGDDEELHMGEFHEFMERIVY